MVNNYIFVQILVYAAFLFHSYAQHTLPQNPKLLFYPIQMYHCLIKLVFINQCIFGSYIFCLGNYYYFAII